jgi:hypothetical protein
MVAARLQLQSAALMLDHPVVADAALGLEAEHLTQFPGARLAPVIVLRLRRWNGKPSVVRRQIVLFQILVRGCVAVDPFPPHFLDQPILMRPVIALHPPFGLGRAGRHDSNLQLLTHASKLRDRNCAPQLLRRARLSFVYILPIRIQRARHPIFSDPGLQHAGCRPDRLFFPHPRFHYAGGILDHVHQAAPRTTLFQPVMKTAVQLHQFPKVGFALSALAMFLVLPLPAP